MQKEVHAPLGDDDAATDAAHWFRDAWEKSGKKLDMGKSCVRFKSLHDLQADYVRYVPWLPYPRLGVAELEPPKDGKTSPRRVRSTSRRGRCSAMSGSATLSRADMVGRRLKNWKTKPM